MKRQILLGLSVFGFLIWGGKAGAVTITVSNELPAARTSETVTLQWGDVAKLLPSVAADHVVLTDAQGKEVVGQPIFLNGQKNAQGKRIAADEFVFQSDFGPSETKTFTLAAGTPAPYEPKVYGRWVPERHDDFAWENDRIAYRIYGPELEIVEPGSSGVDVWPKRTREMIVNKWYQMAQSINDGYYHIDRGDGLDCYKVGKGQGCGGTAILSDGKRLTTGIKGWKTQKVIANGPIRLIFELTYAPIDVNGVGVSEVKRITLDAGQNLNHYQSTFTADKPIDQLQIMSGIVEHQDRPFEKETHKEAGWMTYWDKGDANGERTPPANSAPSGHVGCAVVMPPGQVLDTAEMDHNLEMVSKATSGEPVNFWAGAGWDKSGDFGSYKDWDDYVAQWALRVASPLKVSVSN